MEYNKNFRLQLRHGMEERFFPDRDAAIKYIEGVLSFSSYGKEELLLPYEPVLFFYGEGEDKKAIVMVGLPDGTKYDGKPYFLIDTAYLEEKIDAEDSRHTAIEDKLEQEIADRKAADEAEAKAREEADEIEASYREEADDEEIAARKAADEAEATERKAADEELSKAIEAEAKAREEADEELDTSISNEEAARIKAVEEEAKAREAADKAEETARIEMGEELKEAIDYNKDDIKGVIAACGIIYNDKMSSDRVSYSPDSHDDVIRDAKSVAEAIDKVSKFATKIASDLKISVENTDTVNLTMTEDTKNGGSIIKADVNIAGSDGLSKKTFDNNIMGKTTDGLYAAASIEPSATNPNMLVFKTSGYVDGQFKVDAYETEVPLAQYSGDSGKKTGINVEVDEDKNIVSAQLNLSSDENNILKLEDGEYIVEGRAKNIKYNDTTVAQALTNQRNRIDEIEEAVEFVKNIDVKGSETETSSVSVSKSTKGDFTVSNDVKLSTDKSIIIANGGLSANVKASYSSGTSTLLIEVGSNSYKIDLSELAVSVLKSASYDSTTEEIVLTFIVGEKEKVIRIPVGTLIHDIAVDDTDTIDLTLTSVSGGPNRISAELKVDKTHSDNILTVTSSGAYVSKAYITDAVKEESDARKSADEELKTTIKSVSDVANKAKEDLAEEINRATKAEEKNAAAIAQEIKDARAAEKVNSDAIAANAAAIEANETAIVDETSRAKKAEQANTDAITSEASRAKEAETKNASDITFEVNRAKEKEADLLEKIGLNTTAVADNAKAIADEVKRATDVENGIASDLSNEVLRAKDAEGTNADAITAEVNRATTAEGVLEGKVNTNTTNIATVTETAKQNKADIANEITRAKGKEEANAAAINTEKERALAAEKTNADDISAEATRAKGIEGGLRTDVDANKKAISDEVTRATQNEETLLGKINDEATRAKGEEKSLSEKVATNAANITTVTAQSNSNKTAIEKEIERAMGVETTLTNSVTSEKERATTAETELSNKVSANTTDLKSVTEKVTTLITDLSTETTRAQGVESNNTKAITDEVTRAKAAEEELKKSIDKNTTDITSVTTAVGEIKLQKEGDLSYALYVNGTKHGEITIPQDQFLRTVNYDATTKSLVFVFKTESGDVTESISIGDLVDTYTSGDGLLLNGNAFSVDFTKVASVENVSKAVSEEKGRATGQENILLEKINTNSTDLNSEIVRAKEAEKVNSDAIAQEIKDARAAEKVNSDAISEEAKRAIEAEGDNAKDIASEIIRAKGAESENSTAINTEKERALAAEKVLTDNLATVTAQSNSNNTAIEKEIERATGVENKLISDLTKEATRATTAEDGLKESITANTTSIGNLNDSVTTLTNSLNDEVGRATKAEGDNAKDIASEINRAMEKEADLLEKIGKNATDIASISTSVGAIELKKEGELSYALYVNGTKHGEFSIPQDQFLKSVNYDATAKKLIFVFNTASGDVTSEISIADLIDTYTSGEGLLLNGNAFSVDFTKVASVESVTNAISKEKDRAEKAEATITQNVTANKTAIDNEVVRATKAEEKNAAAIAQEIQDARAAEKVNSDAITKEAERAKLAESENASAIEKEANTARSEEGKLSTSITTETNRALAAEKTNADNISAETVRAKEVESELKESVKTNTESIGSINTNLSTLNKDLEKEVARAIEAEGGNASNISAVSGKVDTVKAELSTEIGKKANSVDVYTKNDITEKLADYAKTADVTTLLSAKANSADVANVYATKESLQEVKDTYATVESVKTLETNLGNRIDTNATAIDNFGLTYNAATSTLTYTNKNGVSSEYKLYSGTLVEEGYFDEKTNSIVLVVKNGETESKITIPVTELLSDVDARITANSDSIVAVKTDMSKLAKDWEVANSSTIELTKSTAGEKDSLTARVKVSSAKTSQAIQSEGDGLYVSNMLADHTVVYGSTGTISAQDAISKLLDSTAANASEISKLSDEVKTYSDRISTLETDSSVLKERVANAEQNIVDVKTRMNEVEKKMETTVETVETYSSRISTLEDSVKEIEDNIGEVDIKGMSDAIETIKTDLIGDKTNPKEGTIWYAINSLIDGGSY